MPEFHDLDPTHPIKNKSYNYQSQESIHPSLSSIAQSMGYMTGMMESINEKIDDIQTGQINFNIRIAKLEKFKVRVNTIVKYSAYLTTITIALISVLPKLKLLINNGLISLFLHLR